MTIPSGLLSCPVCGHEGTFAPHPRSGRLNATCTGCGARERHRMLALYFEDGKDNPLNGKRVLHISPESILARFADRASSYQTSDPILPNMDHRFDVMAMGAGDGSFDVIICNHVLEHVEDDRAALAEFFRVLAPGGLAIITVPVIEGWDVTYEDASINTPELRTAHFGQHDHVRYYGRDIRDRIRAAGFELEVFQPSPAQCVAHAITRGHSVFVGQKAR